MPDFDGEEHIGQDGLQTRGYLRKVNAWRRITRIKPAKQALALYNHLSGKAWRDAEELDMDLLDQDSGVDIFLGWRGGQGGPLHVGVLQDPQEDGGPGHQRFQSGIRPTSFAATGSGMPASGSMPGLVVLGQAQVGQCLRAQPPVVHGEHLLLDEVVGGGDHPRSHEPEDVGEQAGHEGSSGLGGGLRRGGAGQRGRLRRGVRCGGPRGRGDPGSPGRLPERQVPLLVDPQVSGDDGTSQRVEGGEAPAG